MVKALKVAELFPEDRTRDGAVIVVEREGGLTGADRSLNARFGRMREDRQHSWT